MEDVLARYLDGDLDEAEASALLRAARQDPRLEREIREYEALLQAAASLSQRRARSGFADRVMARIGRDVAGRRGHAAGARRSAWLAAAAALVLGVSLGYLGALRHDRSVAAGPAAAGGPAAVVPVRLGDGDAGVAYHRAVRLFYRGSRGDLESVAVAGSFNGWDPAAAPMVRDGDGWSLLLVLPPGDYEYMFVEDGTRWVTDPRAPRTRNDGFGGTNGVIEIRG